MAITIKELLERANNNNTNIKVEEGTFICKINEIKESTSNAGKPMIQLALEVVEGDSKNGKFNHFMSLGSDKGKEIVARILAQLATNIYNISESKLEEDADTLNDLITNIVAELAKKIKKVNATVTVERVKNGDFFNNKINVTKTDDIII